MSKKKIGIVGAGAMGSGIAQLAAMNDHQVFVVDTNNEILSASKTAIDKSLEKFVTKGKLDEHKANKTTSLINFSTELKTLSDCDLVIEAVIEDLDVKQQLFVKVEELVSDNCIMATNTSSLSIASISSVCKNVNRVLGVHFFNPAVLMPLVEIIPSVSTSESIVSEVYEILGQWNKVLVKAKDTPGFIVNRIARPYYGEAIRILEEGLASVSEIDLAMKNEGFRMGPFELMDFIGHNVNFKVTETVWEQMFFDPRYKPSLLQKRLFESGYHGKKSGRGFYKYENGEMVEEEIDSEKNFKLISDRILCMLFNEAADALYLGIASREDIDNAMIKGVNYPKGLLKWCDEWGVAEVLKKIESLRELYAEERYRPSVLLKKMSEKNKTFY